ncbi:glycosyltransferase [Pseudodesulfovibrio cashew]|uniref:Glycosyltransferase n=1 Tax=Pseudodesulfovibrio cashew TaxID=2678688 RepID=A0A6I6JG49_9BACT|nr:glycosyltransferase family 4 protein [Pseudodesulfovibrio cashew]QGY39017.1 glycosyltransferase [Pseudodesulfovibrio cashew]
MPKKVAIYSGMTGGVFIYTCRLIRELSRSGYDVHFITHGPMPEADKENELIARISQSATVHALPAYDSVSHVANMYKVLSVIKPDVILPNYRKSTYAGCALYAKEVPVRIVAVCHNNHESYYNIFIEYEHIISRFICPSNAAVGYLKQIFSERKKDIVHLRHGVPITEEMAQPPVDEFRLIYHGRVVEEQKNISHLIELMAELRKTGRKFRLLIAGTGPDSKSLAELVKEHELNDSIEFLGFLEWGELQGHLASSHAAVLTSSYEGFCLSLAEALGAGLPGVAYECEGAINGFLKHGETGFAVKYGDVRALADGLQALFDDAELWRSMSMHARKLVSEKFSLVLWGADTARVLEASLEDHPRAWPTLKPVICNSLLTRAWNRTGRMAGLFF